MSCSKAQIYYKAFTQDLQSRNYYQFAIGQTFTIEGKLEWCKNGFHCCENILSCLEYYPRDSRFCEIEIIGNHFTKNNKTIAQSIKIVREITGNELENLLTGVYRDYYKSKQVFNHKIYENGYIRLHNRWDCYGQLLSTFIFDEHHNLVKHTVCLDGKH